MQMVAFTLLHPEQTARLAGLEAPGPGTLSERNQGWGWET